MSQPALRVDLRFVQVRLHGKATGLGPIYLFFYFFTSLGPMVAKSTNNARNHKDLAEEGKTSKSRLSEIIHKP